MNKKELLEKCVNVLSTPKVEEWYHQKLTGKNQGETINFLVSGVRNNKLSLEEALCIALVVGYQWAVKFEGVP